MSKMMIVAATSEKMLELMDKITIEEGVISFLASNKATAKGYPCMFSVEGKTTTASVKFEAKIKGLDEKGDVVPVEKLPFTCRRGLPVRSGLLRSRQTLCICSLRKSR